MVIGHVGTVSSIDWLQSLKQFFINVSYHILVASLTLMALKKVRLGELIDWLQSLKQSVKTEPSELDLLQVYDMTH